MVIKSKLGNGVSKPGAKPADTAALAADIRAIVAGEKTAGIEAKAADALRRDMQESL